MRRVGALVDGRGPVAHPGRVSQPAMEEEVARLTALAANGRKALVPFITAGDPSRDATVPVLHALVEAGADLIELGVPFSDPMADGPSIQAAGLRALKAGANVVTPPVNWRFRWMHSSKLADALGET